jgi:hypothetical protein
VVYGLKEMHRDAPSELIEGGVKYNAEWFSQNNFSLLAERLRNIDLVTAVSDYIVKKTNRDFPETVGRSEALRNGIDPEGHSRSAGGFSQSPALLSGCEA